VADFLSELDLLSMGVGFTIGFALKFVLDITVFDRSSSVDQSESTVNGVQTAGNFTADGDVHFGDTSKERHNVEKD
jgi:hypothetical protein